MATIRAYTTIEQSRKLAEILPLESADMCWFEGEPFVEAVTGYEEERAESHRQAGMEMYPCWSLAALLGVLPNYFYDKTGRKTLGMDKGDTYYNIFYENMNSYIKKSADNPVDACVAMIELLHEQKLL